jgi:hypothetical protein
MERECPYCGAELERTDSYFRNGEVLGDIFKCPNAEGFPSQEEALHYDPTADPEEWEHVCCHSGTHSVCGSFYTDVHGRLNTGYPC